MCVLRGSGGRRLGGDGRRLDATRPVLWDRGKVAVRQFRDDVGDVFRNRAAAAPGVGDDADVHVAPHPCRGRLRQPAQRVSVPSGHQRQAVHRLAGLAHAGDLGAGALESCARRRLLRKVGHSVYGSGRAPTWQAARFVLKYGGTAYLYLPCRSVVVFTEMTTEHRNSRRPRRPSLSRALAHAQRVRELAEASWQASRAEARSYLASARKERRERLAEAKEAERHARRLERLRSGLPLRQAPERKAASPPAAADVLALPAPMSNGSEKSSRKRQATRTKTRRRESHARGNA